ncbi:nucleoside hydrolase-like domain-containing protein [Marinoscillum sp.]|uniref:DUF1593 domain-containing protein n=1 Tax=Marinoscillum sp. TaxID=2024838 RepID=UPI003BABE910
MAQSANQRVIVLTDIEADPDDTQSLVRFLLYANEIDIQGLIATTSCWMQNEIHPESIKRVLAAYEKVQPNLTKHSKGYPKAGELEALIKNGQSSYGMAAVGEAKDSEGSEWIIKKLEENDERPLWISIWGGSNTLAQALHKIQRTRNKTEVKSLVSKLRVYTISDQDDSGIWIRNTFPDLFYIVSPGDDYGSATWTGIHTYFEGIDNTSISNNWLAENIQQGHGPLGAVYPDVAWGMEGDTPAFLSLIPNGLNDPEHPDWGGWGGRYELYKPDFNDKDGSSIVKPAPETRPIWTNAVDQYIPYVHNAYGRTIKQADQSQKNDKATIYRWRDEFQNDFAARLDWTIQDYEDCNHAPIPILSHSEILQVQSGDWVHLDALNTTDPDGDSFSFLWFHYPEASTYKKRINLGAENIHKVGFRAPETKQKEIIHIILKVTDRGTPNLTAYKRVVLEVNPKS